MTVSCPLCGGREVRAAAVIDTGLLDREYRRVYGLPVPCDAAELTLRRCRRCDLAFYTPQCPGDEAFYRELQRLPWYYQESKPEYTAAAAHVGAGDAVLEIGGGEGAFAAKLRGRSYRMLELNRAAVEIAVGGGLDARHEAVEDHARDNPEAYDVVCSFQVLEHVPDPGDFLTACLACLRPGGQLIVSVPGDDSFVGRERHNLLNLPPHHMTRWSDRVLGNVAELFGLDVVALHRDRLAPWHVQPYASDLVDRALGGVLRRPWQPLDALFLTTPMRAGRALLRLPLTPFVGLLRTRLRGHSATAVYRKR